jgi:hypothetical protein
MGVYQKGICMSKLKRIQTSELDRLLGYLDAAQHVFIKGELEVTLDATLFEILDTDITDEDVIRAAYPDGFNPIEYRAECSLEEMVSGVHNVLKVTREFWKPEYSIPEFIEHNLREEYWQHVKSCFDYTDARIVALGHDIPYVNIWGGFTYVLYAPDMSRCLLLVGNTSD